MYIVPYGDSDGDGDCDGDGCGDRQGDALRSGHALQQRHLPALVNGIVEGSVTQPVRQREAAHIFGIDHADRALRAE